MGIDINYYTCKCENDKFITTQIAQQFPLNNKNIKCSPGFSLNFNSELQCDS
jgi:hypothetical protein